MILRFSKEINKIPRKPELCEYYSSRFLSKHGNILLLKMDKKLNFLDLKQKQDSKELDNWNIHLKLCSSGSDNYLIIKIFSEIQKNKIA